MNYLAGDQSWLSQSKKYETKPQWGQTFLLLESLINTPILENANIGWLIINISKSINFPYPDPIIFIKYISKPALTHF